MLPSSSSGSLQASSSGSLPAPAAAFMAGQSHPVEIPVSSHGGSAPLLSDADHTRLSDAGITPDLYPELLDSDMHDLGLSLPSIIALRRTRTAVSAPAPAAARAPTPSSSTAPKPVIPTFRGRESSSYQDADEFLIRFEIAVRWLSSGKNKSETTPDNFEKMSTEEKAQWCKEWLENEVGGSVILQEDLVPSGEEQEEEQVIDLKKLA